MRQPDYTKVEGWAARKLTEQQIADVLGIELEELKIDRQALDKFRDAIRRGRAKGEAELHDALFRRAKSGDAYAYQQLKKRDKQDSS